MAWASGQKLQEGKYSLESVLGVGGFGITYLAKDALGQPVVIKTSNDTALRDSRFEQFQQDFVNEAVRLAKCTHPHIVQVHRVFQEAGLWCMVMEYIAGEDLSSRVKKRGILSEAEALDYIQQVGDALSFMHQQGFLHRDVKPENIMLRSGRAEAVLLDLGIAREFTHNSTQVHTAILSNGYAPIEQYEYQARRGAYSDVYGLAATLYFVLTGEIPKDAQIRAYNLLRHHTDPLEPPQSFNPKISDATNQAILNGMRVEGKDRPQSVMEWLQLLPDRDTVATYAPEAYTPEAYRSPRRASPSSSIPPFQAAAAAQTLPESGQRSDFATVALQSPVPVERSIPASPTHKPIQRLGLIGGVILASVLAGAGAAIWYIYQAADANLDEIKQLQASEQYEECISQASTIPSTQPIYQDAQELRDQCAEAILNRGRQLAENNQFKAAIEETGKIPADSTLAPQAKTLAEQWSKALLEQATRLYREEGKLDDAIHLARTIPSTTVTGQQLEETIANWQKEWQANETTWSEAKAALEAGNWQVAKDRGTALTTPYWQTQSAEIIQEADAQLAAGAEQQQQQQEAEAAQQQQQSQDVAFADAYERCASSGGQDCQDFARLCQERGGMVVADATHLDCQTGIETNKEPKINEIPKPQEAPPQPLPPRSNRSRPSRFVIPGDR
jgi:serine/threonine protein kinase